MITWVDIVQILAFPAISLSGQHYVLQQTFVQFLWCSMGCPKNLVKDPFILEQSLLNWDLFTRQLNYSENSLNDFLFAHFENNWSQTFLWQKRLRLALLPSNVVAADKTFFLGGLLLPGREQYERKISHRGEGGAPICTAPPSLCGQHPLVMTW